MDSESNGDSNGDLNSKERSRWTENSKVYTRTFPKQAPKTSNNNDIGTTTTSKNPKEPVNLPHSPTNHGSPALNTSSHRNGNGGAAHKDADYFHQKLSDQSHFGEHKISHRSTDKCADSSPLYTENDLSFNTEVAEAPLSNGHESQNVGDIMTVSSTGNGPADTNGVMETLVVSRFDDRVRFNLSKLTPKNEIMELMKNLKYELDQVSKLIKQLEAKEHQLTSFNTQFTNSNHSISRNYLGAECDNIGGYNKNAVDSRAINVNSEMSVMGRQESRPMGLARVYSDVCAAQNEMQRPYSRQLSVAVMENNDRPNGYMEKEKRTPKANQYYRNSEFLLGEERLPPESNKRLKMNSGRKHSVETDHSFSFGFGDKSRNRLLKSCSRLLQRLMKHKHGWVFNEPVDAEGLGLLDYHDIIEHPMDLGTIKTLLSQNRYESPREFAEDVRLVFRNAITYNPKGQDVHVMAEQLSHIFEERWAIIETEFNTYRKYQFYQASGFPTTSRKVPHFAPASYPVTGPASVPAPAAVHIPLYAPAYSQMRTEQTSIRIPVPKKPKAKDPNKRDMTSDEKQRLSANLQSLPAEKLDAIVQIIKKRNAELSQNDDEIEVDIDNVHPETLWELDRFVTNYKKSLSKYKRKAELALQARSIANQDGALTNSNPAVAEIQIESGTALKKLAAPHAGEGERQEHNGSKSSSSSSDSGSSSSDSDSDSSSADGSDAGNSPRT